MCIAACLTAALGFTACDDDEDEPVQESLVQKSFAAEIDRGEKNPFEMVMSFLDETNVIIRTTTYISLPNKTMAPGMHNIGTYTAKNGEGDIHVSKTVIKDDNTYMSFDTEHDWTFNYDLKTGKMVFDGMVMQQTEYVPINVEVTTPPVTDAGTLPTLDDLQGTWIAMGTTSKGIARLTLVVNGNQATVSLAGSIQKTFSGSATCNNGTLAVGNCRIEFSTMDNNVLIKSAHVYEGNAQLAVVCNLLKQ